MKTILEIPKRIGLLLIRAYQFLFSFDHSFWAKKLKLNIRVCIYEPSCSMYTYDAIESFGLIKGTISGIFRIIRCNPFNAPGFDPLPRNWRDTIRLK